MDSVECYLGLGLILGALIGGLFAEGFRRQQAAVRKIKGLDKQKERASEMMKEAKDKRRQGLGELPGAYLLIFLAIALLIFAAVLMIGGEAF